jgi:hypothetical protein
MAKRKPPVLTEPQQKYLLRHAAAMPIHVREKFTADVLQNLTAEVGDQALMCAIEIALVAGYIRAAGTSAEEFDHEDA